MLNLSLRQLAAIRSVARTGRVNESAVRLGLTAPAVTLQLRDAEREIGARLFERTSGGMIPTEVGKVVIAGAEDVEERLARLNDEVVGIVSGKRGRVRLGAVSTAKYFVPGIIAAFRKKFPGIEVRLLVGNRSETIERLRHRELDLVVMGRPPRNLSLQAAVMGDHPFVIVAPPDHPLVGQASIPRDRLARETFLLREVGSGTRRYIEHYFADNQEKLDSLGFEMGSNESIKQAVMAGLGIALLSAHTVGAEVREKWLAVLDAEGMPVTRQWFCISASPSSLGAAAMMLRDFLVEESAKLMPKLDR